jgi:CxxC motif-containing protein (DUF1111 family)
MKTILFLAAAAPSSTLTSDKLGPPYNAQCCQWCHLKDGRGHPPKPGADNAVLMVLRVSVPAPGTAVMMAVEAYLAEIDAPHMTPQMIGHQSGAEDIGISSPLVPAQAGDGQPDCLAAAHGIEPENLAEGVDPVTVYARNLGVPARWDIADPTLLRGKQMFH